MKRITCALIVMLFTIYSFGQINFERGYFINNKDVKTDCLIKNEDWKNNPTEFSYKLSEAGEAKKADIASIKEFGIHNFSKYIRVNVKIDRSGDFAAKISTERNPIWSEETLFLKVLIEGEASLYEYEGGNIKRFFYSVPDSSINQLIYKKYINKKSIQFINNNFRQQLWANVNKEGLSPDYFNRIEYSKNDLEKHFRDFNGPEEGPNVAVNKNKVRDLFHVGAVGGISYSSLLISNVNYDSDDDFGNDLSFIAGINFEFVMPFNRNKLSMIFEPTFQNYTSEKEFRGHLTKIDYRFIEFPIGLKYRLFLNEDWDVYFKGFFIPYSCLNFGSKIYLNDTNDTELTVSTEGCYFFSAGIEYKRMSMEIRSYTNKEILNDDSSWSSKYNRYSVILGFNLF